MNQRASTRHDVELEARLGIGPQMVTCALRNVSRGGAFAEVGRLPIGTGVMLWFQIGADIIETEAIVRWATAEGVGLQFGSLRARDIYALGQFIDGFKPPRAA
jgi:hypothetical protein